MHEGKPAGDEKMGVLTRMIKLKWNLVRAFPACVEIYFIILTRRNKPAGKEQHDEFITLYPCSDFASTAGNLQIPLRGKEPS